MSATVAVVVVRFLARQLPDSTKGRIDRWIDRERRVAFNGQPGREAMVAELLEAVRPTLIIETGTYKGDTARALASHGVPVHTVESSARFHAYARSRLRGAGVVQHLGDSRHVLDELHAPHAADRVFAYLDAHWQELPLAEELRLLRRWPEWVAVIDDFEVVDDPAYTFDDFGDGNRLDLDYLRRAGADMEAVWYPRRKGADEDPPRRGSVILASHNLHAAVDGCGLVRRFPT